MVGLHSSIQRHGGKAINLEKASFGLVSRKSTLNPSAGAADGLAVQLQASVPAARKQKRDMPSDGSERRHRAEQLSSIWARDFQSDTCVMVDGLTS